MIINLGDAPFKAFITVTYPKGTCTVSNAGTTLSHSGGGTHTFTVNKKGTWTVTAQYSTAVKTASVEITYRGQMESVTLSYTLLLYDNGKNYTDISGGWYAFGKGLNASFNKPVTPGISYKSTYLQMTQSDDTTFASGFIRTKNKIDLTPYKTAYATISSLTLSSGAQAQFRAHGSYGTYQDEGSLASTDCKSGTTRSFSLTNINKAAYICFWLYAGVTMNVKKIWLEV